MARVYGQKFAIAIVAVLMFVPLMAWSQPSSNGKSSASRQHVGLVQDWSQHHLLYTKYVRPEMMGRLGAPDVQINLLARVRTDKSAFGKKIWQRRKKKSVDHIDWSVDLGATMSPGTFPAKYSFDINATPDCVNDFVVYGLNASGAAGPTGQANLVALNYLYTGTLPAPGVCNAAAGGASAKVYWAYAVPNAITTSTVLSLDGSNIAFLESGATPTSPATFHVLKWTANSGSVVAPTIPTDSGSSVPLADQMSSLQLTGCPNTDANTSIANPYIDYSNDTAYVANDNGCIFRIKNVFCRSAACQASPAAPSLDTTWGTNGAIAVAPAGTVLDSPIKDPVSNRIFAGSKSGILYAVDAGTGAAVTGSGHQFGSGGTYGSINMIVDSGNGWVYIYTGQSTATAQSKLFQVPTVDLTQISEAIIGTNIGGIGPVWQPDFSQGYFTAPSSENQKWWIYMCNYNISGAPIMYRVHFSSGRHIAGLSDSTAEIALNGGAASACSGPLTQFTGNDNVSRLFYGIDTPGSVNYLDITSPNGEIPSYPPPGVNPVSETGGITGITVDNVSADSQASSIYFMTLGVHNAVKLTQAGLQ